MGAGLVLEGGRWMSQEEMIEAMGDGDMEAFHLFYQDTARPVYSFILSLTRNPEEAEDVMQDTYLTVWTKAGSYVPQGKPLAWVFTIARNRPRTARCCLTPWAELAVRSDRLYFFTLPQA